MVNCTCGMLAKPAAMLVESSVRVTSYSLVPMALVSIFRKAPKPAGHEDDSTPPMFPAASQNCRFTIVAARAVTGARPNAATTMREPITRFMKLLLGNSRAICATAPTATPSTKQADCHESTNCKLLILNGTNIPNAEQS